MKKLTALTVVAAAVLTFSACGQTPDFVDITTKYIPDEIQPLPPVDSETEPSEPEPEHPEVPITFTVSQYSGKGDNNNVTVMYPILSGIPNADSINSLLYEKMISVYESDVMYNFVSEGTYTYKLDSVDMTFANDSFVSFVFSGSYYSDGAAHPTSFIRTVNVDIENTRFLEADEIITDFDALSEAFADSAVFSLIPSDNADVDKEVAALPLSDLIGQYNAAYGIYPSVYFMGEDDNIMIAISTELVYALGGHAEFSASVDAVADSLSDQILTLTKGNK